MCGYTGNNKDRRRQVGIKRFNNNEIRVILIVIIRTLHSLRRTLMLTAPHPRARGD